MNSCIVCIFVRFVRETKILDQDHVMLYIPIQMSCDRRAEFFIVHVYQYQSTIQAAADRALAGMHARFCFLQYYCCLCVVYVCTLDTCGSHHRFIVNTKLLRICHTHTRMDPPQP